MDQRPLECSKCSKPLSVNYKEINSEGIHCFSACSDCPIVHQKLHGLQESSKGKEETLCCEGCNTSLQDIKRGHSVGCSECYTIFEDVLIKELKDRGFYPTEEGPIFTINASESLHVGKTPFDSQDIRFSKRLINLNDALNDALKIENYEQAAWLRDRIKTLTESGHEQAS